MSSRDSKDRKVRKPAGGSSSQSSTAGNEQVLQGIRVNLAASRKSVTPSPVRETATPSPVTVLESSSPGSSRVKSRPSPVESERQRHRHGEQMARIRDNLKPHHKSDPGFNYPPDAVDQDMLHELIMKGYDQNSSIAALIQCNSHSVEAALDVLMSVKRSTPISTTSSTGLSSIRETSGLNSYHPHPPPPQYQTSLDNSDLLPNHFETTSTSSLPGQSFTKHSVTMDPYPPTLITRDLSPIHSSPDHSPHGTPPPESKRHVHVSPPPDVQPRTYSPFSAPFSRQMQTPPVYDRNARLPHGYSPIIRPASELSDSGIEEETAPQRNPVPPEAFKFYMEQHIENVLKAYQQRQQRRMKLEVEMGKRGLDEATCEQMRKLLAQKESNFLRMKRAKMHRDQFDIVKPIGVGAFGVVSLVKKKDTRRLYAMKSLRKADVVRRNQVAHVKAERDILAEADNEWVVKLYYSFQDAECLYFVMEYIPGGDMMSLLIKLGTFPEHLTLFYIAELVCAIESVHKMGFIHRDIKPDNILIEADGHIKLTDFGLCTGFRWTHDSKRYQPKGSSGHTRQGSIEPDTSAWGEQCTCPMKPLEIRRLKEHHRCVAHSLVGTPNYIAPEILRRVGYTQLCDWWSVGVIMYEMLVGQPPFMASAPADTQLKIVNWPEYLRIPHHAQLSTAARDLVLRFLSDPQDRIGRNGADEIKHHPFFTSRIDWDVGIRNYVAPYKPKIMYEGDTSNFDPVPQSQVQKMYKQATPTEVMPQDHPEHAFYEFTFIRFAASDRASDAKKPTIAPSSSSSSSSSSSYHSQSQASSSGSSAHDKPPSSQREHKEMRKEKKRTTPQPVYV